MAELDENFDGTSIAGSTTAIRPATGAARRPATGCVPRSILERAEQATRGDGKVNRREWYEKGQLSRSRKTRTGAADATSGRPGLAWRRRLELDTKGTGQSGSAAGLPRQRIGSAARNGSERRVEPSLARRHSPVRSAVYEARGNKAVTMTSNQAQPLRPARSSVFGSTVLWISASEARSGVDRRVLAGARAHRALGVGTSRRCTELREGRRCCACSTARRRRRGAANRAQHPDRAAAGGARRHRRSEPA